MIKELKEKVLKGGTITKEEAMKLITAPLKELTEAANEIREKVCGQGFDLCTIVNGKCGKCSEGLQILRPKCPLSYFLHGNLSPPPYQ